MAILTVERIAACSAVFEPADPPRAGSLVWYEAAGGASRDVVTGAPIGEYIAALPVIRRHPDANPVAAFWSAAAELGLNLVARGRVLPGVSTSGFDAWRVGPLDAADVDRLHALVTAMPACVRAAAERQAGRGGAWELGHRAVTPAEAHVRAFLDAIADTLPRLGDDERTVSGMPYADMEPQRVPHLRSWADEVAAGLDAGVRISLRLDLTDDDLVLQPLRLVVLAHSLADPSAIGEVRELWDGGWGERFGPRPSIATALAIRRAARVWQPLEELLHLTVPGELELSDADVGDLLDGAAARLSAAGIDVHWPSELADQVDVTASVSIAGSVSPDLWGSGGSAAMTWQFALAGTPLTEAERDQLAVAHRPIVQLRDRWVLVPPAIVRRARERQPTPLKPIDALTAALAGTVHADASPVQVAATGQLEKLRQRLAAQPALAAERELAQPRALDTDLRDYQLRGLRWLAEMTELGFGGCLADDMGLGKTVTLIALHLHRQADAATAGPTLVVCPASLLGNWQREIERFAPGTPVRRFHGADRSLAEITTDVGNGFVLTTYGTMRRDAATLGSAHWGLVVADEAQHVKNPMASTAKALRQIPAVARVALTGTPVENNLTELWSILDWTTPGLLGSLGEFRTRWADPIETGADPDAADRLGTLVRPFVLRRRKSDPGIAPELPSKTQTDRPVGLSREQAGLYEAVVREIMEQIRNSDGMARRGLIMKLFTGLKQICNHPAHYLKEIQPVLAGRSGKLDLLDELVDTILSEDGAILVFTQYVAMARLLERHLADRDVATQFLHGGTPVARRDDMVQAFQSGAAPVFLLSLKAAGTGLNLTRADHVIHYDRWWNPAVEDQATDRAYRIGQTKPVQVHRLIAEGTLEDQIATMLESKRELADSVLSGGEAALTELTDDELAELVALRSTAW